MTDEVNVFDFFQSGFYEDYWGWEFTEDEARTTAEKCAHLLNAKNGHILDWCGGWGRISYYLSQMGFRITILDYIESYLQKAVERFGPKANLTTICMDCRNTPAMIQADYAICIFNSLGFLPDDQQVLALRSLYGSLVNNGKVILDCMDQLFIVRHFLPVIENKRPDGIICKKINSFSPTKSILYSTFQLIDDKGQSIGERKFEQRIYTPLELDMMLNKAGFKVIAMYGDYDKNEIGWYSQKIITLAEKN